LWLFLALWVLDYSIDVPDPQSDSVKEDLSFNDIESISELVFEYVLGWENFVPEHDEDDSEDSGFAKKIEVAFVWKTTYVNLVPGTYILLAEHFFKYTLDEPEIPFIPGVTQPPQA
jgi:hypothetical protein